MNEIVNCALEERVTVRSTLYGFLLRVPIGMFDGVEGRSVRREFWDTDGPDFYISPLGQVFSSRQEWGTYTEE